MALFKKRDKKRAKEDLSELPKLPESSFPKLPEFPRLEEEGTQSQLPSLPKGYDLKLAVTGEKEDEEKVDEFEKNQRIPKPQSSKPLSAAKLETISPLREKTKGPVFIRIDKFQESLEILRKTKDKISEMEKMLSDIKSLKEKEERELQQWEGEIQNIKNQIEKVDKDVFSRIE